MGRDSLGGGCEKGFTHQRLGSLLADLGLPLAGSEVVLQQMEIIVVLAGGGRTLAAVGVVPRFRSGSDWRGVPRFRSGSDLGGEAVGGDVVLDGNAVGIREAEQLAGGRFLF